MNKLQHFFFTEHAITVGQPLDLRPLRHQLQVVLRLQAGAQLVLLDGTGRAFLTQVKLLSRHEIMGEVIVELPAPPEPVAQVTLYPCTLKADKFEWVLQKATELGVARVVPVISQRSIVRPAAAVLKKYERWHAILREAAEQCGRGRLPELGPPLEWPAAIAQATGLRLLPWEAEAASAPTIQSCLAPLQSASAAPVISLLIGPEGGISAEEAAVAQSTGWQPVSLGPRILRAETAALASLVLVMTHVGEL
ncbi:MAG: 16S rRNA (uracil(1498)-N(3))-methyltransferase [Caldilineaceae bacterium]|nr:16S rRNA (uracil(1498)-N(3))-methyltransferase [Caldilineaceae bacterium]